MAMYEGATYVHVVRPEGIRWAMRASRAAVERRVREKHGFGLEEAGAELGDGDREQAAVLAASVRAWKLDVDLERLQGICRLDRGLDAVAALFTGLTLSARRGFPDSAPRDQDDDDVPYSFRGYAGAPLLPAAAVAISVFSGPVGRRRLATHRKWFGITLESAARRVVATDEALWGAWEAFGAAVQMAWFRGYWIAIEGYGTQFVCFREAPGPNR